MNLPTDASKDDLIHCFKESEPCHFGAETEKLNSEFREPEFTDTDVKEATVKFLLVDQCNKNDDEDDLGDGIDVEL